MSEANNIKGKSFPRYSGFLESCFPRIMFSTSIIGHFNYISLFGRRGNREQKALLFHEFYQGR